MENYINTEYLQNIMTGIGCLSIGWGFGFATILKFMSYGIFKAMSLLNMRKY